MSPLRIPRQSYLAWKVVMILMHSLAVLSTVYRLCHRFRKRRLWWDDYIVLIPLMFNLMYWIVSCAHYPDPSPIATADLNTPYNSYWLVTLPGIMIFSGCWIVLALMIARLFPLKHPARRWSFGLVLFFALSNAASIGVTIGTCQVKSGLLNQGQLQGCVKGLGGFIVRNTFLFAESLANDMILIIFCSVILFWARPTPAERRVILIILWGCVVALLYAIAFLVISNTHAIYVPQDLLMVFTGLGNTQSALSLFIVNLPVLCSCLHGSIRRLFRPPDSSSVQPHSEQQSSTPSASDCSCSSDSPTPLTLTEISDLSYQSTPRSYDYSRTSEMSIQPDEYSSYSHEEISERGRSEVLGRDVEF